MRLTLASTAVLAATLAAPLCAHDFWIDLPRHRFASPASIEARFLIGDKVIEPWLTSWPKIVSFRRYGPDGVADLQSAIHVTTPAAPGSATLNLAGLASGTHVIALESNHTLSDLPAAEFNAYAEHEGLALALDHRRKTGTQARNGRELYSRRAKALVQIGPNPSANVTMPIGQTLEIVPQSNPYALSEGAPIVVQVRWHGQALAGASVVLESLDAAPGTHGTPVITDAQGMARFPLSRAGRWRFNCVWSAPIDDPRAELETIFASLTFGF